MLHFYDRASMAEALTLNLSAELHTLLSARIAALGEELIDWTEYLVVEAGDCEADIVRHVGFSPLVEPFDGIRFGQPSFHPHWDWLIAHTEWFEMSVSYGSTFAYVLLIENHSNRCDELIFLCREYATKLPYVA